MSTSKDEGTGSPNPPARFIPWQVPELYGTQAALIGNMGSVAAPLLGGFSLAAIIQTLTLRSGDVRWPDAVLLLFMLAAILFIGTVQATFWARQFQASPAEIKSWWPDADNPDRLLQLSREQRLLAAGFRMWTSRARVSYDLALLFLLAALTTLAVPPSSHGPSPVLRWVAVAVGVIAFGIEAASIAASPMSNRWRWANRLFRPPPPDYSVDTIPVD